MPGRTISRYAVVSLSCLPLAGFGYVFGWLAGRQMEEAGQGWEMAFYLSPLVFLAVDSLLVIGAAVALIGVGVGPGVWHRVQATSSALLCVGCFLSLPWR